MTSSGLPWNAWRAMTSVPNEPRQENYRPPKSWQHIGLYNRVMEALLALPGYFRSETFIVGVSATDLHTLDQVLGATIEEQTVATLNNIRDAWDPEHDYSLYGFFRQPQTFPDVYFRKFGTAEKPLMGIELKGWYVLAKEGEPNFRFQATPDACASADLIVVVPWVLSQVISGHPIVMEPFVESARFAAEYRNYWWQHVRKTKGSTKIDSPKGMLPYPRKTDSILDVVEDKGGNFGRLARTGLIDRYCQKTKERTLCGVPLEYWLAFFKSFTESGTDTEIREALSRLARRIESEVDRPTPNDVSEALRDVLNGIERLLGQKT